MVQACDDRQVKSLLLDSCLMFLLVDKKTVNRHKNGTLVIFKQQISDKFIKLEFMQLEYTTTEPKRKL